MIDDTRTATDKLLAMYQNYKKTNEAMEAAASRLARAKARGDSTQDIQQEYSNLQAKLQEISEGMTFASPIIWMMYKYEAYVDEAQPIRTMQDFRIHCSKPGYICTKRFNFVCEQLDKRNLMNLNNREYYPDERLLPEIFNSDILAELATDESFQRLWRLYEYNKDSERVAKWENYPQR